MRDIDMYTKFGDNPTTCYGSRNSSTITYFDMPVNSNPNKKRKKKKKTK